MKSASTWGVPGVTNRSSLPSFDVDWARFVRVLRESWIALLAIAGIVIHLALGGWTDSPSPHADWPLFVALALGGSPLLWELLVKLFKRDFGSDLLAGLSIIVSIVLGEYLAGTLVVLMLSGGEALEAYAVRSASSVLQALAKRMPSVAHRLPADRDAGPFEDVELDAVQVGDRLVVLPHDIAPVDGIVIAGQGVMDESFLTGEPFQMRKTPGSNVISGAINGETALTIRAVRRAEDSRYAKIMRVMQDSEQRRPNIRRLADRLGAFYTPIAIVVAALAWLISGDPIRFLAVLVVATPCPLLIAIPVAIIGSISLAAKRGIIIRNPTALEVASTCRTMIFDKTGTLTYGSPQLSLFAASRYWHDELGSDSDLLLTLLMSLERYSKHPLAHAIVQAGEERKLVPVEVESISERPGEGLTGQVRGREVRIISRKRLKDVEPTAVDELPESAGLECVALVDGRFAALLQFRDVPRRASAAFVKHLGPQHHVNRTMLLSGDRAGEVAYLADRVGIDQVLAEQSPEDKVAIVRRETEQAPTIFVGDGINDAPALTIATVGIAFGQNNEVTSEAADVVVMDSTIEKVDEFLHIGARMRSIGLQSAVGGMAISIGAMGIAAVGLLPPVAGALVQEVIDVFAVLNALRVAFVPKNLRDFEI
ncbi:MAG: heavy metal translocating P-type ATPase [Pirellulaceae bacterium]